MDYSLWEDTMSYPVAYGTHEELLRLREKRGSIRKTFVQSNDPIQYLTLDSMCASVLRVAYSVISHIYIDRIMKLWLI